VAQKKEAEFMEPKLRNSKPQMKELNVQQKVSTWSSIYGVPGNVDCGTVSFSGRDVVIVDDLYQSGVSMWAYAKFLKESGANRVFGLAGVKSMRDSDNT
jgi:predicted amidophosphoribosyltransferase